MSGLENIKVNSTYPCLIIYLIDQSGSMADKYGNGNSSKAEEVANAINELINEIGQRCLVNGEVRDRFELAFIGYGAIDDRVVSAWEGSLTGRWVVKIKEVFDKPLGTDGDGMAYWIEPVWGGNTPMKKAFENAKRLCSDWINYENHRECYPPIIINISDGAATDGGNRNRELREEVHQLKELRTNYGNVNLFNIHISSASGERIIFPATLPYISDAFSDLLFELSTPLNGNMVERAQNMGINNIQYGSKGYVYNGNAMDLLRFLNITSDPQ